LWIGAFGTIEVSRELGDIGLVVVVRVYVSLMGAI